MTTRLTLPDCIGLATWAHRNQLDKAGYPYIEHPLAVLKLTQDRGLPPFVQMAAVFHDTTEDTDFTIAILLALGLTPPAADLVELMDRKLSEAEFTRTFPKPRMPWYERDDVDRVHQLGVEEYRTWKRARDIFYYQRLRTNKYGPPLKECDMSHNSLPWRLSYLSAGEQEHARAKYDFGRMVLNGEITE